MRKSHIGASEIGRVCMPSDKTTRVVDNHIVAGPTQMATGCSDDSGDIIYGDTDSIFMYHPIHHFCSLSTTFIGRRTIKQVEMKLIATACENASTTSNEAETNCRPIGIGLDDLRAMLEPNLMSLKFHPLYAIDKNNTSIRNGRPEKSSSNKGPTNRYKKPHR